MPKEKGKISQCPPNVERLINAANSLPANFQVPFEKQTFESIQKEQSESIKRKKAKFYEILRAVPKDFIKHHPKLKAFLGGKTVDVSYDFNFPQIPKAEIKDWYECWQSSESESVKFSPLGELKEAIYKAVHLRKMLVVIADYGVQSIKIDTPSAFHVSLEKDFLEGYEQFRESRKLDIDIAGIGVRALNFSVVEGVITEDYNPLFSILINEKIDIRRIKHCQNCQIFFWVKRLNKDIGQNTVCEKCSNAIRQKRFAKNNPEKVKKDKRAIYIRNNPNSKVALLEKKEMEKQAEWRKRRDRDFSKTE